MNSGHDTRPPPDNSAGTPPPEDPAVRFVRILARELSSGQVMLPSFPDVAVRVRRAVDDEHMTHARLARIVGAEAGLAARIVSLANSAAYSRGGPALTDLKLAIARLGLLSVRNAALAFSIAQLQTANELGHLRRELKALWTRSALTASLAHVIAARTRFINADDALLAGLLHNIGKLYMLARAGVHRSLLSEADLHAALQRQWHASIGQAIAANWGLPKTVSEAIGEQDALDREHTGRPDLSDVLIVAVAAAPYYGRETATDMTMQGMPPFDRLNINEENWPQIVRESSAQIAELKSALSG